MAEVSVSLIACYYQDPLEVIIFREGIKNRLRVTSSPSRLGKISKQRHPTLCIQFLDRENNDKNNTFPLGKQICFTIVWSFAEIFTADCFIQNLR